MRYLITATKRITLDGVERSPGDIIDGDNTTNVAQLIRRGLAIPLGDTSTEQAETSSPSSEPAHTPPVVEEEAVEEVEETPEPAEEPAPTPPRPQGHQPSPPRRSMTKAQARRSNR